MSKAHSRNPTVHRQSHSKMGPLTMFAERPEGVRFETQEAQEKVILFLRPHIIVNFPWMMLVVLMILTPGIVLPLIFRFIKFPFEIPPGYLVVGMLFWYTAIFGFALASFLRWFFNIYIVTNERVVDIDFFYLLYKKFSEARLSKIQDISYKSSGILSAIFNFGDVAVQTAGENPEFEFIAVPQPEKVVRTIGELIEKAKNDL